MVDVGKSSQGGSILLPNTSFEGTYGPYEICVVTPLGFLGNIELLVAGFIKKPFSVLDDEKAVSTNQIICHVEILKTEKISDTTLVLDRKNFG